MHKGQVVLLHGLIRTANSMRFLASRLKAHGYETTLYGYPSRREGIAIQAERFSEFLKHHFSPGTELSFVTHSLGSLILRAFVCKHHELYQLKRAVMLGPPNQGSRYARMWRQVPGVERFLGPAFQNICDLELGHGSDRLEIGIIAGGTQGGRGLSPILRENNDGVVTVTEARLEGAKDFTVVAGWHSLLMYQPKVISQAIHFLDHGQFQR